MKLRGKKKEMDMKNNILIILAIIFSLVTFFISKNYTKFINYIIDNYSNKADTVLISDTITTVDTLTLFKDKPIPKKVYITKVDTFYTKEGNYTVFITENKIYQDTLCNKKDSIILQSYISGQNVQLDSIKADWRKSETIITNTVEVTKYIERPKKLWNRIHLQPQVTGGYDIINKQWGVTAGIGVGIDLY